MKPPQAHTSVSSESASDPVLQGLAQSIHAQEERPFQGGLKPKGAFLPPKAQSSHGWDAQVNMIHGAGSVGGHTTGMATGFLHPMLSGNLQIRPSLEAKHQGGWKTFAKRWSQWMVCMQACNGDFQMPEAILLENLKGALDSTDQKLLELRREQNPSLTMGEFWQELQSLYDKDSAAQNRLAWESTRLPQGELSLDRWLEFLREFQLKRDRVEDRTDHEEYQILMKTLPPYWQKEVVREEAKRGRGKWLVRMTNIPTSKTLLQLKHLLEDAVEQEIQTITPTTNGVIVVCSSTQAQTAILGLGGYTLDNQVVKCSRMEPALSGEEICDLVTERLQTEHRLKSLQQTWGSGPKTREVQVVSTEKGKGKGAGESRSWKETRFQGKGMKGKGGQAPNKARNYTPPREHQNERSSTPPRVQTPPRDHQHQEYQGHQEHTRRQTPPRWQDRDYPTKRQQVEQPRPQVSCSWCQLQNRPYLGHTAWDCRLWKQAQAILGGASTCRTCQRGGWPDQHPFQSCQWWLAEQRQNKGKGSPAPYNQGAQGSYNKGAPRQAQPYKGKGGRGSSAPPLVVGDPAPNPPSPRGGGQKGSK